MTTQNDFYYKNELEKAIQKFMDAQTKNDHEFGLINDELVNSMTEAAWLILKQSIDVNRFIDNNK